MSFDTGLLKTVLRCPRSKTPLVFDNDRLVNCDSQTRLAYAVVEGIPNFLVDEATSLSVDDWNAVMQRHPNRNRDGNG